MPNLVPSSDAGPMPMLSKREKRFADRELARLEACGLRESRRGFVPAASREIERQRVVDGITPGPGGEVG